jgi:alkylhydroperoxidase family enzyme
MGNKQDFPEPPSGWAHPQAVRIPPPPPARRGVLFRAVSGAARLFRREEMPAIFPVFNIHRRLFWPWLLFASQMMPFGKLPGPLREMLILRTAWHCRSRYEWGQHVEIALDVGVTDAQILALSRGPQYLAEPVYQLALQACDELCTTVLISDATWQPLSDHFTDREIIEITLLVGHYRMVAGLLINSGIALETSIETVLQAFNARAKQLEQA